MRLFFVLKKFTLFVLSQNHNQIVVKSLFSQCPRYLKIGNTKLNAKSLIGSSYIHKFYLYIFLIFSNCFNWILTLYNFIARDLNAHSFMSMFYIFINIFNLFIFQKLFMNAFTYKNNSFNKTSLENY